MNPSRQRGARVPRVYVDGALSVDTELTLERERSHHLVDVLRLAPGAPLVLFDGSGTDWAAVVEAVGRRVRVRALAARQNRCESPVEVTLWQGLSQGSRMDACLRQATELGIAAFRPLVTQRCQAKFDAKRAESKRQHWHAIAISAAEQCGRARVPSVHALASLDDALANRAAGDGSALVLAPRANTALANAVARSGAPRVDLLVGPESGLSDAEIANAIGHGFEAVRVGPRTLRTETAGPAAVAVIQAAIGDMADR